MYSKYYYLYIYILLQIVAVVVKYADNVLKGFATSLSILISCLVSWYSFHDIDINSGFTIGAVIVLASVYVYGYTPTITSSTLQTTESKALLSA